LNKRKKKMEICATSPLFLGVGPQGPLPGDFPAAGGLLPFHAFRGAAAVPARHRLVLDAGVLESSQDLFVIFHLFWTFL
jgi:hypothetical protein